MDRTQAAYYALAILNGALLVAYGGHDDSPGAQFLGALLVVSSVIGAVKKLKKRA
jgi:hypothetical protein